MKPILTPAANLTDMLKTFMSQKVSLLNSLPVWIAMPIRVQSRKMRPLTDQPILFKGAPQRLELIPICLSPKRVLCKSQGRHTFYSVIGLMGCFFLTGCTGSTYSSHFDCPMGKGAGCASLSRVNKMIDRHEIDLGNDDAPSHNGISSNQLTGNLPANQVYVYYGPDQLSRLIPLTPTEEGK